VQESKYKVKVQTKESNASFAILKILKQNYFNVRTSAQHMQKSKLYSSSLGICYHTKQQIANAFKMLYLTNAQKQFAATKEPELSILYPCLQDSS
jgi:hypothetical protein